MHTVPQHVREVAIVPDGADAARSNEGLKHKLRRHPVES